MTAVLHRSTRRSIPLLGTLGLGVLLLYAARARAEEPAPQPGVEVQARGAVHEAFAEAVTAQAEYGPVVTKQPPDPIQELPPDQKPEGDAYQWIGGYWTFDEDRNDFVWLSGIWRQP